MENNFLENEIEFVSVDDETTQLVGELLGSEADSFLIDTFSAEEDISREQKNPFTKVKNFWSQKGQPFVNASCTRLKEIGHTMKERIEGLNQKQKKYIFSGTAGVLAVLMIVCVLGFTVLRSPAAKVGIAINNTLTELEKVSDLWGLNDLASVLKQKSHSVDMEMRINSMSGEDTLSGTGVRFMMDSNFSKRKLGLQVVPYVGTVDLMHVTVAAEDEMVYFASPEFLPDIYGFNTLTLMDDLDYLGADLGKAKDISFNLFDVMDLVRELSVDYAGNNQILADAWKELLDSVSVEKGRKQTIRVNGTSTECKTYLAVIPEDAIEYFLETLEDVIASQNPEDVLEEVLESMNFPRSLTKNILDEFNSPEPDFDVLYDLLDEIGDLELRLYVKNNRIAAVRFECEIYDSEYEAALYIGGGDQYVDNLSLKLENEFSEVVIKSSGDHSAKKGVFTDKTTIEVDGDRMTVQVTYNPKSNADNLSVIIEDDRDALEMNGTYLVNSRALQLHLDEIAHEYRAEEDLNISFSVQISKYNNRVNVKDARLLSDMDESDMEQILEEVESMAGKWTMDLLEKNPELMKLF